MSNDENKTQKSQAKGSPEESTKEDRLAEALRANLRKRKTQAKTRLGDDE